jgi:transglutaminase-like putative cysteine protease
MTRYRLRLQIGYSFDALSGGGRKHLRITPATLPGLQYVDDVTLTCNPLPLEKVSFTDFFGTQVTDLLLPAGVKSIQIDLLAQVTRDDPAADLDLSAALSALPGQIAANRDLKAHAPHHYLGPSPRIPPVAGIAEFARHAIGRARSARDLVATIGLAVHRSIRFDATATDVDTPVAEAFALRRGVCQDMAQIMICALRGLGIPASYVSGFLRTVPPPGQPRLQGADAMHAWVRAWTGAESGWVEYDPTNACFVGSDHIVVGYGRDYGDAAPVIGILRLSGNQAGHHSCDIEPA